MLKHLSALNWGKMRTIYFHKAGKMKPVPTFEPQTEEQKRIEAYGKKLMELRQGIERAMQPFLLKNR